MSDPATLGAGWTHVCSAAALAPGQRKLVELASGDKCVVLNVDDVLYAVAATCTHRALSLEAGPVQGERLVCPWHRARFDLATGQGTPPATVPLTTFDVAVVDGAVQVRAKEQER